MNNESTVVMSAISSALNLNPLELSVKDFESDKEMVPDEPSDEDKLAYADFETARTNLLDVLKNGKTAIEHATTIALASQSPRSFEALSKLLKDVAEANQGLMDLHEKKRALSPRASEPVRQTANSIINNNIIIGSPAQLLDFVRQARIDDAQQMKDIEDASDAEG